MIKNLLYTFLLLAVLTITSIMALFTAKKLTRVLPVSEHTPDYFMTNLRYQQFNQNGQLINRMQMARLLHFENNNNFFFEKLRIQSHQSPVSWYITADQGKSLNGKSAIYLWPNVKLVEQINNRPALKITTSHLTYYPTAKVAKTTAAVTIEQPKIYITALGAEANLKTGNIHLLKQVVTKYQTQ